jgi:hypothetical protein
VTKAPPPQQNPSFAQKQGAMQEHPGRPLEPQQDREVPPHPPAAQPQSKAKPSNPPPPKAEGKDKDKPKN